MESARPSIKNAQVSRPITRWCISSQIKTFALFDTACLIQYASSTVMSVKPTDPRGVGPDILTAIFQCDSFPGASFLLTASEGSNITVWS